MKSNKKMSTAVVVLIPIAVGINLIGGVIVNALKLPIFLDSIGTLIVGILAGPWIGALTGILFNFAGAVIIDPVWAWYAPTSAVLGFLGGFLASKGFFKRKLYIVALGGVLAAVLATIVSAPISVYVFGGVAAQGQGVITTFLVGIGKNLMEAVLTAGIVSNLADKVIVYALVGALFANIPKRFVSLFPYAKKTL